MFFGMFICEIQYTEYETQEVLNIVTTNHAKHLLRGDTISQYMNNTDTITRSSLPIPNVMMTIP